MPPWLCVFLFFFCQVHNFILCRWCYQVGKGRWQQDEAPFSYTSVSSEGFFFLLFFFLMWLKKKERKSCSLRCFGECRYDAFRRGLMLTREENSFVRTYVSKASHFLYSCMGLEVDWLVYLKKGSLKCRRPTYKIRIRTEKEKRKYKAGVYLSRKWIISQL